jgi:hypothetical protein
MKPPESRLDTCATRLLDFYTRQEIYVFFHYCEEMELDLEEAFIWVCNRVEDILISSGTTPPFDSVAAAYVGTKGYIYDRPH